MRTVALCFVFLISMSKLAFSIDPPADVLPNVSRVPLSIEDLTELLRFDSYKFQIDDIKTGDRFRIEIRSYTEPTAEPKILWSHEFVKTQFTCRGPLCDPAEAKQASFRIDFRTNSTNPVDALNSQDSVLNVSVVSNWLRPSGIHGSFDNPLKNYDSTEKAVVVASKSDAQLPLAKPDASVQRLIYMAPNNGFIGRPIGKPKKWDELFPRAEVVLYRLASDQ